MTISGLRLAIGCLAGYLLVALPVQANQVRLPDLGDPADSALSIARERELGAEIMQQIRKQQVILDDLIVAEYINDLGYRLLEHADAALHDFQLFVVKDKSINAFALPGGYIGFHAGLILMTENEGQLAAVAAHEISHITQRHVARSFFHNEATSTSMLAAMIAGVFLGGEVGEAAVIAAGAGSVQSQINFTRKHEHEADRIGIDLLGRSGFDADSMATLFETMRRQSRLHGGAPPEFLSTHPIHETRIAEARARAQRYSQNASIDSEDYRLVHARLRVLTSEAPHQLAADIERALDAGQTGDELMDRYALALALLEDSQFDKAARQLDMAIQRYGSGKYLELLRADIRLRQGQDDKALQVMQTLRDRYPLDHIVTLEHARMLIDAGKAPSAQNMLEEYIVFRPGDPDVYKLLAHAAKDNGDSVRSHAYMAEHFVANDDPGQAIAHIETALAGPIADDYEEARLRARLKELRNEQQGDRVEEKAGE